MNKLEHRQINAIVKPTHEIVNIYKVKSFIVQGITINLYVKKRISIQGIKKLLIFIK